MSRSPRIVFSALAGLVLVGLLGAGSARAQAFKSPTDTLNVVGRSSYEDGFLFFLNVDRVTLGPRAAGMGGAGLALAGGVEMMTLNPVSLLGLRSWELISQYELRSGSGGVNQFPSRLDIGSTTPLTASGYRVNPSLAADYDALTLGFPLVLLGHRGALGISYHRLSTAFQGEETRFEVVGPVTNNIPATNGVGSNPDGGPDAITVGIARQMSSWLGFGANLNFQSGEIRNRNDISAAVFGLVVTGGGSTFKQNVDAFNVDLGAQADFGRLNLGGVVYLGYDLNFTKGHASVFPLPDIQDPNAPVFQINTTFVDHTLSVPTSFGVGASLELSDRMTVAADYWNRPLSKANITRDKFDPVLFFTDPSDSSTFGFLLTREDGQETFSAGYDDNNSLRFGVEYQLIRNEKVTVPVRFGFRSETLALNNIEVPESLRDYPQLVQDYWHFVELGETPPAEVGDADAYRAGLTAALEKALKFNYAAFLGSGVDANTVSFGFGIEIGNFTIDATAERTSYDIDRFFFQNFDPTFNPIATETRETRSIRNLSIATRMRF